MKILPISIRIISDTGITGRNVIVDQGDNGQAVLGIGRREGADFLIGPLSPPRFSSRPPTFTEVELA